MIFYYIPSSISGMSSSLLPESVRSEAAKLVSSFINPALPAIGLALAAVVFAATILKGTRPYGIILMIDGLLFAAYTYIALQGGKIIVTLPTGLPQAASGSVTADITLLMLLLLIPSLLTILKGAALLLTWEPPAGATRTSGP